MRILLPAIVFAVCSLIAIRPASAGPVTFTFSGAVESVEFLNPVSEFGVGDTVTLVVTFESETADSTPSPTLGTYNAITSIQLNVGTYSASANSGVIRIQNDDVVIGDAFQILVTSLIGPPVDGIPLNVSQLQLLDLRDATESAFASDALPATPFSLTPFVESEFASLRLRFGPAENSTFVGAQITALNGPEVPEPGPLCLIGCGAIGLAVGARRRANAAA